MKTALHLEISIPPDWTRIELVRKAVGKRVEAKHEISRNGGGTWEKLPTLTYVK